MPSLIEDSRRIKNETSIPVNVRPDTSCALSPDTLCVPNNVVVVVDNAVCHVTVDRPCGWL